MSESLQNCHKQLKVFYVVLMSYTNDYERSFCDNNYNVFEIVLNVPDIN